MSHLAGGHTTCIVCILFSLFVCISLSYKCVWIFRLTAMHPLSSFFIINEFSLFMMNELALLKCLIFFQLIIKKIWRMISWSKLCWRWVAHWGWLIGSTPKVNSAFWIGCLKICDDFFTKNSTPYKKFLLISECSVGSFMSSHSIRPAASLFTLVLWPALVFGANGGCILQLRGPAFLQKALSNPFIVFCFYCALSSSAKQIVLFLMLNTGAHLCCK